MHCCTQFLLFLYNLVISFLLAKNYNLIVFVLANQTKDSENKVLKLFCRPQTAFFPLIKVSPQFLIKGISSIKPLIREKERERGAPKAKEGCIKNYKFLLSLQSHQGVA